MKKSVIRLLHVGYWLLYLVLIAFVLVLISVGTKIVSNSYFKGYSFHIMLYSMTVLPALIGFYGYYGWLFDRYLRPRKEIGLLIYGLAVAFGGGLAGSIVLEVLFGWGIGAGVMREGWRSAFEIAVFLSLIALLNGGMGLLLKGFISWYGDLTLKEELARKNVEAELALIKARIEPHFLFNTLHNIDVLIELDPQRASLCLNKLSDIMRYTLYDAQSATTPLSLELQYIRQYIELQKIRTANAHSIIFETSGDPVSWSIAPMTLISFIENAFKHGEYNKTENEAVRIHVEVNDETLRFECANKYTSGMLKNKTEGGMGNELIMKRLNLLYPDRHHLKISDDCGVYRVALTLTKV